MIGKILVIIFLIWIFWPKDSPKAKNPTTALINPKPEMGSLCESICRDNPNEHIICKCEENY